MGIPESGNQMSVVKLNRVQQEFRNRAGSFGWLNDDEIEKLPGPIAFEYKRLHEFTEEGNIEASLWKLVNLSNVTLSYLFAAAVEKNSRIINRYCPVGRQTYAKKGKNNQSYAGPGFHEKRRIIEKLLGEKMFSPILDSIEAVNYWRNNYGIGHGALLRNQTYYISEKIIKYYSELIGSFQLLPNQLNKAELTLKLITKNSHKDKTFDGMVTGPNYFENVSKSPWESMLICESGRSTSNGGYSAIRLYGYGFDLPDIYFLETFLTRDGVQKSLFRNYSKNRIKVLNCNGEIAWDFEPHQVAWLNDNEREDWLNYYKTTRKLKGKNYKANTDILMDAAENFHQLGDYDKAKEYATAVSEDQLGWEHKVISNMVLYSSNAAQGNEAETFLLEAKKEALKGKYKNNVKGIIVGARIADLESWHICESRKNVEKALKICNDYIKELEGIKEDYPLTVLLLQLELRKNRLYASRDLDVRDFSKLREKARSILESTREIYLLDSENRRNVDIHGFACNHYREFTCKLIKEGKLKEGEIKEAIDEVGKIIDEGLEKRERAFKIFDRDIWSMRGYAWSKHDKARFLMDMTDDYNGAKKLLKEAKDLRQQYEKRFPANKGILADLIENYVDLYRAESGGKHTDSSNKTKRSKNVSELLYQLINREGKSERVKKLLEYVESYGLQYIEKSKGR